MREVGTDFHGPYTIIVSFCSPAAARSSSDSDIDKELIRWIIDESVYLRNKKVRLVILVSKASYNVNHNIAKKTFAFCEIFNLL